MLNLWIWSFYSWTGFYIFLSFLFLLLFPNSLFFLMGISSPLFSNASVNLGRSCFFFFFKSLFLFLEHPCSYVVKALSLLNSQAIIVLLSFSSCTVHICGDNSSLWDCCFLLMFPSWLCYSIILCACGVHVLHQWTLACHLWFYLTKREVLA